MEGNKHCDGFLFWVIQGQNTLNIEIFCTSFFFMLNLAFEWCVFDFLALLYADMNPNVNDDDKLP